jgi:hypothetical protein
MTAARVAGQIHRYRAYPSRARFYAVFAFFAAKSNFVAATHR